VWVREKQQHAIILLKVMPNIKFYFQESLDDLPEEILNKDEERLQFKKMEEQIKDFLL